ncbi:unnamed protein product [Rotaria sordida]|uniref:Uncharacterized protein n=1 Tax=Rotaria sordida TaxID=392033 RepID=A0A815Q6I6_9BILA|nr:unnamed protein product [Rotaria sordida]CAF4093917.1 unnamed protein product [Rotaria sordida]
MNVKGDAKNVNINIGDSAIKPASDTPVQTVMKTVGKTASKVIESGGDIITTPAAWLKDMQQNCWIYMVAAAIILSSIVFLYCVVHSYFARKQHLPMSNIVELAAEIGKKHAASKQQLVLPTSILPRAKPHLFQNSTV